MHYYENKSIKDWIVEDRPREKLQLRGNAALTDAELLATLIGSGTRSHSALDLARLMLEQSGGLEALATMSVNELKQFMGIGLAKASIIACAFELSRRSRANVEAKQSFNLPNTAGNYLCARIGQRHKEVFYVLFLDNHGNLNSEAEMFSGGSNFTVVDSKLVCREAILRNASRIIVAHNHPSGVLKPSPSDDRITASLVAACRQVGIGFCDHFIVGGKNWYSYNDTGALTEIRESMDEAFDKLKRWNL